MTRRKKSKRKKTVVVVKRKRRARAKVVRKKRRASRAPKRTKPKPARNPHVVLKAGAKFFDGSGMVTTSEKAARFTNIKHAKHVAKKLANALGKPVAVHS